MLSNSQAGPGKTIKQEQEEISRDHVQAFIPSSVVCVHRTSKTFSKQFRHQSDLGRIPKYPRYPCGRDSFLRSSIFDRFHPTRHLRFSEFPIISNLSQFAVVVVVVVRFSLRRAAPPPSLPPSLSSAPLRRRHYDWFSVVFSPKSFAVRTHRL